jgi:LPXTG-motif cell wall-anchored protein
MRRLRVLTVAGATGLALALAPGAPAFAVDPEVITHTTTEGVESDGGATTTVEPIGLRFVTPANARANFYHRFITAGPTIHNYVMLASITDLWYKTKKIDTTTGSEMILPAYKMEIYCDQQRPYTTLVYEPYRQDDLGPNDVDYHAWQTWDVDAGEFWSTYEIGGNFGTDYGTHSDQNYQAPLTEILGLCPEALVISFQVGQGASPGAAEALADELFFEGAEIAIEEEQGPAGRAMTGTKAVKDTPDYGEPFAIKHVWRGPTPSASPLPATGAVNVMPYVYVGAALVLLGAVVMLIARRRRASA